MSRLPVLSSSIFRDYFSDKADDKVFLLSNEDSEKIWTEKIDKKANSYFRLSDNNWLISDKSELIGKWIEDFNEEKMENVKSLLDNKLGWEDNDTIWYCINKNTVLETLWSSFKVLWIEFLYSGDDCPIILNSNIDYQAIIFRPIGDFVKISSPLRRKSSSEAGV